MRLQRTVPFDLRNDFGPFAPHSGRRAEPEVSAFPLARKDDMNFKPTVAVAFALYRFAVHRRNKATVAART